MRLFLAISSFVSAAIATSRTTAPAGAITVGSGGTYSTVSSWLFKKKNLKKISHIDSHRFKLQSIL
jgi:hypothetical protein